MLRSAINASLFAILLLLPQRNDSVGHVLEDLEEDRLLGGEEPVDQRLRDARFGRHGRHRRGAVVRTAEDLDGAPQDLGSALPGGKPLAWAAHGPIVSEHLLICQARPNRGRGGDGRPVR